MPTHEVTTIPDEVATSAARALRNESGQAVKPAFLVGCPRSGTTWAQLLLAQHPEVATVQETHLFSGYVAGLERRWRREAETKRQIGLRSVLDEEAFLELCRMFSSAVMARLLQSNPAATVIVEKTPEHGTVAELILRLVPEARFLHVIRDPRSVSASLLSAGKGWGKSWAPKSAAAAAERWRSVVAETRQVASITDQYLEVRYEDLERDGVSQLGRIFAWLDLPVDDDFCERAVANCDISRLKGGSFDGREPWAVGQEPTGFFRKGTSTGWKDDLRPGQVAVVEYVAAELMAELGYQPTKPRGRRPLRLVTKDVLQQTIGRLCGSVSRFVNSL